MVCLTQLNRVICSKDNVGDFTSGCRHHRAVFDQIKNIIKIKKSFLSRKD